MNLSSYIKIALLVFFILIYSAFAQTNTEEEYITIKPGAQYEAGWLHEFFFGAHWRDVWTTPVKVEILDLNNFDGGIIPIKRGGGQQTKSLRFKSKNGQIWKFRSVAKDPSNILPPDLQETIADDIVQDQISTANPMAPFVVSTFLDAVGLIEAKPYLVFLPDDERLGEFRQEFGGLLGFIEIHPSEGENGEPGFNGAIDVKGTYKLLNYLEEKRNQKINSRVFLTARLIDILLGDWDRHMDQWRWVKYSEDEREGWYPIPRDRDQVFSKYDGIFPFIAAYLVPPFNNFGYDYPQMEDLTWNGKHLDRRVLTELDKPTWDSIATFVQAKITDDLIDAALNKLPVESYSMIVDELRDKLISRRDKFQNASNEFYRLVNRYADVFCSAKDDCAEVNRINDNNTEVTIYKRDKKSGEKKGEPLFHKIFNNEITIDLRIHMNDGDDIAVIKGECDYSPLIRIIGGNGKDELKDESIVNGYFLSITPFHSVENKTIFYDSGKKTIVHQGAGTVYDNLPEPEPKDDSEKFEPSFLDRGNNWIFIPKIGFNSDEGFIVGGGLQLHKYNFRKVPQEYKQELFLNYATRFGKGTIAYRGDFYSLVRDGRLNLLIGGTEQFITRYFGYGNETTFNIELEEDDFYEVDQSLITLFPTMFYDLTNNITGNIGLSFIRTNSSLDNDTLLTGFRYRDYGKGKLNRLGIHLGFEFEGRNNIEFPTNGYFMSLAGSIFPAVFNIPETFYNSKFDLRGYITHPSITWLTLALRASGEKVWGKYPFYAGATIGGIESIRGYNQDRFSGDAALFGQAELRIFLTHLNFILRSKFGLSVFVESGKVWAAGEDSKKWHPSYGLGLWLNYLDGTFIISSYVATSPERTTFAVGLGMGF
jgi:hypothetical protein